VAGVSNAYLRVLAAAGAPIVGTPDADVLTARDGDDEEIYGLRGDDALIAGDGNDALDGGLGADRMEGGAGDDTYFVETPRDRTEEAVAGAAGGVDLVRVSIDWRLGPNLENLRLHGPAIVGEGNGLDNLIIGNGNANRLHGYGGADRLVGLGGDDRLVGGAGDDTFFWGPDPYPQVWLDEAEELVDDGADVIHGGPGSDTFVVPTFWRTEGPYEWSVENGIVADLAAGTVDHVDTGFLRDLLSSIENIRTGNATDRILGSQGANVIECGGGYNVVRARGGDDVIVGGATQDGGDYGPKVMERLDGGAGDDVIDSGGSYWEYKEAHYYEGGVTTDRLFGRGGADHLIGGKGHVAMTGGQAADLFETRCDVFVTWDYDTYLPRDLIASTATITDFDPWEGDRIELRIVATHCYFDDGGNLEMTKGPAPTFVGANADVDVDEIGYTTVERSDGSIDTVIAYRFLATWPGYAGEVAEEREFRIVLEDYDGGLTEDWFTIL